jgi:hypothetical protein
MENLISIDTICFITFLAFMLGMKASAKVWRDAASAPKRCAGLQQRDRFAYPQFHCTWGPRRPPDLGAEATVSESPRDWCRRTHRASAHGKECTPC